jgi:hypothetical protein
MDSMPLDTRLHVALESGLTYVGLVVPRALLRVGVSLGISVQ